MSICEFHNIIKFHFENLNEIYCGSDFKYAKNAQGNSKTLNEIANVKVVDFLKIKNNKLSTTMIKKEFLKSNFDFVNSNCFSKYFFTGKIFRRSGIGKKLGFPTINLKINKYKLLPGSGIYICYTEIYKKIYYGILSIGHNPTINYSNELSFEIYLLKFNKKMIKEKIINVWVFKKIRETIKFKNSDELISQMKKDLNFSILFLKNNNLY